MVVIPRRCACTLPLAQDRQRRAEWRVGTYVRVHGHLSTVGREKSMVAFNMRLVQDFNEVGRVS